MKTKEEIEQQAKYYAHNNFEMHELNHYKALEQGFKAGAEFANPKSTPITKEGLIEMGFVEVEPNDFFYKGYKELNVYVCDLQIVDVFCGNTWITIPNATTIQDIKDLIRLFKIEK